MAEALKKVDHDSLDHQCSMDDTRAVMLFRDDEVLLIPDALAAMSPEQYSEKWHASCDIAGESRDCDLCQATGTSWRTPLAATCDPRRIIRQMTVR